MKNDVNNSKYTLIKMKYVMLMSLLFSGTAFGVSTTISSTLSSGVIGVQEVRRTGWDSTPEAQKVYSVYTFQAGGSRASTGVLNGGGYHYAVMVFKLDVSPTNEFFMDGASVSEFKFTRGYGQNDMPNLDLRLLSVSDNYPTIQGDKATYDWVINGNIVASNFLDGATQLGTGQSNEEFLDGGELTSLTSAIKNGGYNGTQEKYLSLAITLNPVLPADGSYAGFEPDSFSMELTTAVPEPATYAIIMGLMVGGALFVFKRK